MLKKIVFLDRDGTICEDSDYLDDWRKMKIYPYSLEALKIIRKKGYGIYVITNQAGVAKGKFSIEEAENQKRYVLSYFNRDEKLIDDYLYCPHHRDGIVKEFAIECNCRKPKTGLIERVINPSDIDKDRSYVVGDKVIDLELAINLGVKPVLLLTGYGSSELQKAKDYKIEVFNDLLNFARDLEDLTIIS